MNVASGGSETRRKRRKGWTTTPAWGKVDKQDRVRECIRVKITTCATLEPGLFHFVGLARNARALAITDCTSGEHQLPEGFIFLH